MTENNKVPWWGMNTRPILSGAIFALLGLVVIIVSSQTAETVTASTCDQVCKVLQKLEKKHSENIDLRARVVYLEEELKNRNPPGSRHFYDCKPAAKEGMWNLVLYSNTTNTLWAWNCDGGWNGSTPTRYILPPEKQKKLTCKDQKGTEYPYVAAQ